MINRKVQRPTLDGVLSLNSSQVTNTNVSIVTSSSTRLSTARNDRVAASYVVSDSGAQLILGGAYHVSSTGAHEMNPVTGSTTRLGRTDSGLGGGAAVSGGGSSSQRSSLRCGHISELDMDNAILIGSGSSGRAYNVLHTPSGVRVCVKQMKIDDTRHREEVKRELDALHNAASRFVIDFYGAFFQNDLGVILLVLELMEGSLLDVMRSHRPPRPKLPERCIRAFALQVVVGLEWLHDGCGMIHRDIKPANLLFHRGGALKLADFGVSSEPAQEAQEAKTFVGSVLYMAPERLQGQPYSYSVDVWSLGITLYQAAVGRHPYQAEGSEEAPGFWELMQRAAQQDERLHSSPLRAHGGLGDTVSEDMDQFVALCLAFDPTERPTAAELKMHPWLQSISQEESEAIVAEVHVVRQTAAEQPSASVPAASTSAGVDDGSSAAPQALQCSSMLVGTDSAGGSGGGRRQRGDALLSELVASFQTVPPR